jgi:hypothetical protein
MLARIHPFIQLHAPLETMQLVLNGQIGYVFEEIFRHQAFGLIEHNLILIIHQ